MTLQQGTVIADRYRLMHLIATGGMGQVWAAVDTRLNRRVAVKVLKSEYSNDPEFISRFRIEAQTTAQLNNPGIANIFDYGETPAINNGQALAYLVMELVNGEPLNAVLSRIGRLPVSYTLDLLEQTGRALQAAHDKGLIHRDVKPGNIMLTPTGQVKITDFGIVKATNAAPVTQTGMVMGTAQYISPEQANGYEATSASDVYSLGVVGYEALTGHRPFNGDGAITIAMKHLLENPPPLPNNLPPNVRRLIESTLVKDPRQRYSNGGEFAAAVSEVRAGRTPPAPRTLGAGVHFSENVGHNSVRVSATVAGKTNPKGRTAVSNPDSGWTAEQKALAAIAVILLLTALVLIGFLVANRASTAPFETSTTVLDSPKTAKPVTTTLRPCQCLNTPRVTTTMPRTSSTHTMTESSGSATSKTKKPRSEDIHPNNGEPIRVWPSSKIPVLPS